MERLSDEIINKYIAEMRVVVDAHKCDAMYRDNMLALIELKQYRDTGLTPEQIRELKERNTAQAPEPAPLGMDGMVCPACGKKALPWDRFCGECGQRFWEDEENV